MGASHVSLGWIPRWFFFSKVIEENCRWKSAKDNGGCDGLVVDQIGKNFGRRQKI